MSGYTTGHTDQYGTEHTGTGARHTATGHGHPQEKKGMMEKITDMLPGGGHKDHLSHPAGGHAATGTGTGTHLGGGGHGATGMPTTTTGGEGYGHPHEKKGMMEKVTDMMPGGHKDHLSNPAGGHGTGAGHMPTTTTGDAGYGHPHQKKGLMEKITEKMPGGHKDQLSHTGGGYGTATGAGAGHLPTTTGDAGYGHPQEKKGMVEKITDKMPGAHQDHLSQPGGGYGTTTGTGTGMHGTTAGDAAYGHPHEKKGMMEKIKEKIPGAHTGTGTHTGVGAHTGTGLHTGAGAHTGTGTHAGTGTHTTGGAGYGHPQEKKGVMEKIKEKLPGHHN